MTVNQLIADLRAGPVPFSETMAVIDAHYHFKPTGFQNGEQRNEAGTNNGSCKIFAFARLHDLPEQAALNAFGHFYTEEVLGDPDGSAHANIRQFMQHGWGGVEFDGEALEPR